MITAPPARSSCGAPSTVTTADPSTTKISTSRSSLTCSSAPRSGPQARSVAFRSSDASPHRGPSWCASSRCSSCARASRSMSGNSSRSSRRTWASRRSASSTMVARRSSVEPSRAASACRRWWSRSACTRSGAASSLSATSGKSCSSSSRKCGSVTLAKNAANASAASVGSAGALAARRSRLASTRAWWWSCDSGTRAGWRFRTEPPWMDDLAVWCRSTVRDGHSSYDPDPGSDLTRSPLELTRSQILAFRRHAGALDERLPLAARSLRQAAWAGLQDSMPRAALLSIHARVGGAHPSVWEHPSLVQVWGPRFSTYVVPARDRAVFTLGRLPDDERGRRRADEVADRLHAFLDGRRMGDAEAARALGKHPNWFRYGAASGRILIRWDGARQPTVWTVPAPEVDPLDARRELARRYLHVFGPTTHTSFAAWAGIRPAEARAAF